ncbi:hypothetical protein LOTGIDRAFT_176016 [Lottia gigantea]|uniref:Major facilitator superfamily (MFS) profile domain-containing protein n=1 Tax=Lottia gigantea TaxID=225164 RepID=V3ZPN5_LOTGI|nr:hypothetical protein LOTGIDRAFT_176016 [Lottia gigantea]ESO86312.1 hypothetical protein LOTGIDRAFT_176016 [Lottia gigantea]
MERKYVNRGILSVAGAMLIELSLGTLYIFGNYTPYFTSYLRNDTSDEQHLSYGATSWVAMAGTGVACLTGPLFGLLERVLNYRALLILSCFVYSNMTLSIPSGGILSTYYTVQYSLATMIVTFGICTGIGKIVAYPAALKCAMEWFPERSGLISGLVLAGYGLSSFIFNWVITLIINPNNLTPDIQVGNSKFFSQKSVLDKVPESFLILGAVLVGLQVIGILLISDSKQYKKKSKQDVIINTDEDVSRYGSINAEVVIDNDDDGNSDSSVNKNNTEEIGRAAPRDYAIKEAFTSSGFYILWCMMLPFELSVAIIALCYKTYGQTFIRDDHFLAMVGSLSAIFNAGGRLFWGSLGDKLGHKLTMCLITASFSVFISTLVMMSEYGGKYIFLIWICLVYFSFSGIFSILPVIVLKLYGAKNYLTIYNAVRSSGAVSSVGTSLLVTWLEPVSGWADIFLLTSGLTSFGFCMSVLLDIITTKHHLRDK